MSVIHPVARAVSDLRNPADDWAGAEPTALRDNRRREFLPQLLATASRALFVLWGIAMSIVFLSEIAFGWEGALTFGQQYWALWAAALLLSVVGAALAFRVAADLDGELIDDPGPSRIA